MGVRDWWSSYVADKKALFAQFVRELRADGGYRGYVMVAMGGFMYLVITLDPLFRNGHAGQLLGALLLGTLGVGLWLWAVSKWATPNCGNLALYLLGLTIINWAAWAIG